EAPGRPAARGGRGMSSDTTHLLSKKRTLLEAMLVHVPFDGWSHKALAMAARDCGFDAGLVSRAFPDGAVAVLDFWVAETDAAMPVTLVSCACVALLYPARVRTPILPRVRLDPPHRESVRRALSLEALPQHAPRALHQLYRTVDVIWNAAGDTATDFNFYTKRL